MRLAVCHVSFGLAVWRLAGWLLGEAITPALVLALVGVGIGLALLNRRRV